MRNNIAKHIFDMCFGQKQHATPRVTTRYPQGNAPLLAGKRMVTPALVFLMLSFSFVKVWGQTEITSLSSIGSTGDYIITDDIDASGFTTIASFSGTLEAAIDPNTHMPYRIKNLTVPLFTTLTGTVKSLVIESVSISKDGQVGAIACVANGSARIYNVGILGGSVESTGTSTANDATDCCGGLVGFLDETARVINCYSYANITGGNRVGGIVGYNNVATTSANLKTMVMNCMFYGDITGGVNKAPIYNGKNIVNRDANGVSNFNYFLGDANYVKNQQIGTYNCALMAETRFLQRFEFFRHLLNSHRELAAWWATGDRTDKDQMLKWVMEPEQIGSITPYPILKQPGRYRSVVYIDDLHVNGATGSSNSTGTTLGTLKVNIRMGSGGAVFSSPTGATINVNTLNLNITDKDPDHFNFNYYKVQLPYYNDLGTNNYRKASDGTSRVVTGWKIVDIVTDGSIASYNSFTTGEDAKTDNSGELTEAPYNFADRRSTEKDLFSKCGRVFNQGAYWDVPEGVTEITIEPYWAKAAYLADSYVDVVCNTAMSEFKNVPNVGGGQIYTNDQNYSIAGEDQKVYTGVDKARNALGKHSTHTVYDYAIVLVGNAHNIGISSNDKEYPYTIMSADFDHDNEPDYSYILRFNGRSAAHPVRVDFLNIPGLGMAQKSTGGTGTYNFGIMQPLGWFEATNTSLFRVTQFEYDQSGRIAAPLILQGGVMEQWVSGQNNGAANKTIYFHVGGNVWFKEFHRGCHQDKTLTSKHPPVSVTGGDYDEFYLTGLYRGDIANYNDNAECYINGGRFGTVAGAAMEGIGNASTHTNGNIVWQIYNADIDEFYGGGINAAHPVEGNITNVITGGYIKKFCGGPKFGDMNSGKTVITTATGCKFDTYFGAGYGGNSYSRYAPKNKESLNADLGTTGWNDWVNTEYTQSYNSTYKGVSTTYTSQYLPMSSNTQHVARLLIDFVSFSLATTHSVTSKLTGCIITGNFYGGGSLGKVDGTVTSTLNGCTINGSVFGAGYSAKLPTVEVMNTGGFAKAPFYDNNLGVYMDPTFPTTETYTWQQRTDGISVNSTDTAIDKTNHILYTTEDLTTLGTVTGNVTLNIEGTTKVSGDVYGGGALASSNTAASSNLSTVNLKGGTISGSVYGGGMGSTEIAATVGSTLVNLNGTQTVDPDDGSVSYNDNCVVEGNIFGCNNVNGTPLGNATVHIFKTQGYSGHDVTEGKNDDTKPKATGIYELKAVYGGGNLAAYDPNDPDTKKAKVIIDGCGLTSIETVYGGGNAASAPATEVEVNGTYEIGEVFGGGNGKDAIDNNTPNPGAHVGYKTYPADATYEQRNNTNTENGPVYIYGTGQAQVNIKGGTIHSVYGGSNTKGNVRQIAVAMLEEVNDANGVPLCDFNVDDAYGGGKSAPMDGEARLEMKCIPGMTAAYGGSRNADVNSGVTLNITNGKFEKVFGGNNEGGCVKGSITVNIEETGCRPVEIGELYGGGNQAAYSKYGYKEVSVTDPETSETTTKWVVIESPTDSQALTGDDVYDDPQVNVKSFTSIGSVFGGGLGATATMVADPHVNINQVYGKQYDSNTPKKFVDQATTLGTIGTVYGGGNAAPVIGDTYVNVGTKTTVDYVTIDTTKGETEAVTGINVVGANITGNVYGGGNAAKVTGRTKVTIGKEESE